MLQANNYLLCIFVHQKLHKWNIQLQYSTHKVNEFYKEKGLRELKAFHKNTDLMKGLLKRLAVNTTTYTYEIIIQGWNIYSPDVAVDLFSGLGSRYHIWKH